MAEANVSSGETVASKQLEISGNVISDIVDSLCSPTAEQVCSVSTSPSMNSVSSSLLAQLKLDDEFFLESRDLMVRVDNPEKHSSALESYITFRVLTKTTRSDYDSHEYCVRRRYNDFIWLQTKLEITYPTHIIPPLPEKHNLQRLNRFNLEFIKTRMSALNKFIARVADHPVLGFDKSLQLFLTSKPFEFTAHKKEGPGIMGRMSFAFQNIATTYMLKMRTPEFEQVAEYVRHFEEKVGNIERIAHRINSEQQEYVAELREFHPIFTLWSSSENQLGRALVATAGAVEKCARAQEVVVENFGENCGLVLREYILYANAIKAALRRRDTMQIEYELTVDALNNKKFEKDQLETSSQQYSIGTLMGKSPEDIRKDKQEKIDVIIESLIKQVENNNDKVECGNANLRSDLEHWQKCKNADFKQMFVAMANQQIRYYESCFAAWEEAILLIRDTDCDLESSLSEEQLTN